tara:strand:+ start:983 stop:1207 length:225 start_codon:yes stop_codon:yes gene_type:complete
LVSGGDEAADTEDDTMIDTCEFHSIVCEIRTLIDWAHPAQRQLGALEWRSHRGSLTAADLEEARRLLDSIRPPA